MVMEAQRTVRIESQINRIWQIGGIHRAVIHGNVGDVSFDQSAGVVVDHDVARGGGVCERAVDIAVPGWDWDARSECAARQRCLVEGMPWLVR